MKILVTGSVRLAHYRKGGDSLQGRYHHLEDTEDDRMSLRFLRDSAGREIDFIVTRDGKPLFAVECKTGERDLSRNIPYYATRSDIPVFYQVHFMTGMISPFKLLS